MPPELLQDVPHHIKRDYIKHDEPPADFTIGVSDLTRCGKEVVDP